MSHLIAKEYQGFVADQFVEVSKLIKMPSKPHKIGFVEVSKTKMKNLTDEKNVKTNNK